LRRVTKAGVAKYQLELGNVERSMTNQELGGTATGGKADGGG